MRLAQTVVMERRRTTVTMTTATTTKRRVMEIIRAKGRGDARP